MVSATFFAGITSSIAITQPVIAFLEDELGLSRKKAVSATFLVLILTAHLPIFLPTALDEMDFWAGTFLLVVFGLIEILIFLWALSPSIAWAEINRGGLIKLPRFFFYIIKIYYTCFLRFAHTLVDISRTATTPASNRSKGVDYKGDFINNLPASALLSLYSV